jgi:hypothetical protein
VEDTVDFGSWLIQKWRTYEEVGRTQTNHIQIRKTDLSQNETHVGKYVYIYIYKYIYMRLYLLANVKNGHACDLVHCNVHSNGFYMSIINILTHFTLAFV